jgi:hypothetical protein
MSLVRINLYLQEIKKLKRVTPRKKILMLNALNYNMLDIPTRRLALVYLLERLVGLKPYWSNSLALGLLFVNKPSI